MTHKPEEFSILDIGVLAEHWIAITIIPLIIGFAAYAWAASAPPVFTASVSLEVPIDLDTGEPGINIGPLYRVAFAPRKDIQTEVSRSGFIFIGKSNSAAGASELARAAYIEAAAALIEELDARIADARSATAVLIPIVQLIEDNLANDPLSGRELIDLRTTMSMYEQRIEDASRTITALETEPLSTTKRIGMQPLSLAGIAWVAAVFALLSILSARQAWKVHAATEEGRQKLDRVSKAFHIKPRTMA